MPALSKQATRRRARGIGGSEAAIAIGVHPSITPLQLYRKKVLGEPLPMTASKFALALGHQLEPVVAWAFTEQTGIELEGRDDHVEHPDYPYIRGYVDRVVVGRREGFEAKAWNAYARSLWGESTSDDVPMTVLVQCVHYLLATGFDCWHVGALLGGDFRHYTVFPDDDVMMMVREREQEFWRRVQLSDPPPATSLDDLRKLYAIGDPDRSVEATEEDVENWTLLREARERKRQAEADIARLEFRLKQRMKTSSAIVSPESRRKIVTWRNHETREVDIEALKRDGLYDAYTEERRIRVIRISDY